MTATATPNHTADAVRETLLHGLTPTPELFTSLAATAEKLAAWVAQHTTNVKRSPYNAADRSRQSLAGHLGSDDSSLRLLGASDGGWDGHLAVAVAAILEDGEASMLDGSDDSGYLHAIVLVWDENGGVDLVRYEGSLVKYEPSVRFERPARFTFRDGVTVTDENLVGFAI